MTAIIKTFILGPIENNTYLAADKKTGRAAVIDPAAPSREMLTVLSENNWKLSHILITHAHFDHIGGVRWLRENIDHKIKVIMHRDDFPLWIRGGGSKDFGFDFDPGEKPDNLLEDDKTIMIGDIEFKAISTPGHTKGHITYYSPVASIAFCGDLIFYHGIGRTDLPVSSEADLFKSIKEKIFTLPPDTILYPGHGPQTTVMEEIENNPFI